MNEAAGKGSNNENAQNDEHDAKSQQVDVDLADAELEHANGHPNVDVSADDNDKLHNEDDHKQNELVQDMGPGAPDATVNG